jgi:hypothetical protein
VLGVDVFSTAAGYSAVGTPLAKLLQADFATAATALTQQLLNGAALGYGAKKIALNMTNAVTNISLDRALTISRTEIMRAYNSTSLENYKASGVVSQWKRVESKSPRTCLACIIADGTLYPTSTSWYDHPRGRGTLVPVVDGMPPPEIEPARVWFEKQSESTQQKIMGKGHYDAWVRGVELDRMVTVKDNETWGKSLSITPLGALK